MKLTDVVNESLSGFIDTFTPEQKERLYKKAKTIFKVFKKGKITRSDGVSFSYELGDYMRPRIDDEGDLELFASVEKMTELTWCPINHEWMTKLVEEKFKKMFGINIELTPPRESNLVKWTGKKPWDKEEPTELNESSHEDYVKKQIKKGKTVYNALKSGTIGGDDPEQPHFKYKLPDKFSVFTNNVGVLIEIERIKIKHLNRGCLLHSSDYMSSLIRKKFGHFGIVLTSLYGDRYFQYDIDSWESPNE